MKIKSVRVKGFKNIQDVTVAFDKMAVLVSENSYGKSNVMTAINFAVEFIHCPKIWKYEMMGYEGGIPFNTAIDSQNFCVEFELEDSIDEKSITCLYGYEFIWDKDDESGAKIIDEWLYMKENAVRQKYSRLISRSEKALYKASVTGRCSSSINVDDNELIINKLMMNDGLFYYPVITMINSLQVYVERHLDASYLFDKDPVVPRETSKNIAITEVDNIPRTVYFLKEKYQPKYELLINAFMQLFPNITDIDVKEFDIGKNHAVSFSYDAPYTVTNKVYSMYVKDKNINQPLDFKWLSDGAKRIFLMLTYAIVADINNLALIAFEEPENSIHPALLQNYLDILYQLSDNCAILCASHSPYVLQYVRTGDIYIGKPNHNGLADFAKIDESKVSSLLDDAAAGSESVGNYIFELLSGGEDDLLILQDYLEN